MRDLFRGWKRKLGCATLVLACLIAVGWVRKLLAADEICFRVAPETLIVLGANHEVLNVAVTFVDHAVAEAVPVWSTYPANPDELSIFDDDRIVWRWKAAPFGWGYTSDGRFNIHSQFVCFPHWSLVLPLTLISGWLLLSEPKRPDPIHPEQAA